MDNLNKNYVPCHCCRDKMSDASNEHLLERQIGGSNPCQRKRIHANVNDFNDTVWLDAIEKVNECSRTICNSLINCEDEETLTSKEKDPCSKKSSKSIYADCHSRQFQDCEEEPTTVCRECSNTKPKKSCEHKKLKDVYNAIEDLYGIANEHRSQHQCPNCGKFKQIMADVCNPCAEAKSSKKHEYDRKVKSNHIAHCYHDQDKEPCNNLEENTNWALETNDAKCAEKHISNSCQLNPSRWIPANEENDDELELKELVDVYHDQRKSESTYSFADISNITKQIEGLCASIGCNRCSSNGNRSNQCTPRISGSIQDSESSVQKSRSKCSCCQQHSVEANPRKKEYPSTNKPTTNEKPCDNKAQFQNSCNLEDKRTACLEPTTKEQQSTTQIEQLLRNQKEKAICPQKEELCNNRENVDVQTRKENFECNGKDSCLDICNEPSYTKLKDCSNFAQNQSCINEESYLKSPVASEVLCTLNRICDILVKYEKNLKINSSPTKCDLSVESKKNNSSKPNESANLSRSSICNSYPESDGFTTPKNRVSVSILEETEEANTENKSCDEPVENICIPEEGQTTERTTSFHSKECIKANCESQTANSNPGSNGTCITPGSQNCCFPCIPIFPMPICADSIQCWPFICCPKEVRNCNSDDGDHKCKHASGNNTKGNGVVCIRNIIWSFIN